MAICIRCRRDPCRCAPPGDTRSGDAPAATGEEEPLDIADLARLARIRTEATALSPVYVAWIDSGKAGPEPLIPGNVRRRIRDLMDEAERIGK